MYAYYKIERCIIRGRQEIVFIKGNLWPTSSTKSNDWLSIATPDMMVGNVGLALDSLRLWLCIELIDLIICLKREGISNDCIENKLIDRNTSSLFSNDGLSIPKSEWIKGIKLKMNGRTRPTQCFTITSPLSNESLFCTVGIFITSCPKSPYWFKNFRMHEREQVN